MAFLDKTGLTYFWGKIKAIIGTGTLNTTNKTIIPAINELNENFTVEDLSQSLVSANSNYTISDKVCFRMGNLLFMSTRGSVTGSISNAMSVNLIKTPVKCKSTLLRFCSVNGLGYARMQLEQDTDGSYLQQKIASTLNANNNVDMIFIGLIN